MSAPNRRSTTSRVTYGDSTPFPLTDEFGTALVALADACVALFHAELALEGKRAKADAARQHADTELGRLSNLESWVGDAIAVMLPTGAATTPSEVAASRIAKSVEHTLKKIRADVGKKRDAAVRVAFGQRLSPKMRRIVDRFFVLHALPGTRWSLHWHGGDGARPPSAQIRAKAEPDVAVEFSANLVEAGMWAGPVQPRSLGFEPVLDVPASRTSRPRRVKLKKHYITELEASPAREAMTLRPSAKKPGPGIHVLLRRGEFIAPVVTPIDEHGAATGDSLEVSGAAVAHLSALWSAVLARAPELVAARDGVVSLQCGDQSLAELERPAALAEALLASVAPIVRELRLRSSVPGELVLKRQLTSGQREEILIPLGAIRDAFADLPDRFARVFEAAGLGADPTAEGLAHKLPLMPRPMTETGPFDRAIHGLDLDATDPQERIELTDNDVTRPRARPPSRPPNRKPRTGGDDDKTPLEPVAGTIEAA